ncbi:biogenesis of lysosome-related organelles complex 1 subunit 4-like [Pollicipes pollicipes]|uniref:biogenesis of lysosome-related organelles complex 1 subunit 4-like n=1 Tax=Pollicipes pollicipes TaxID=41117 RepID=UPI001885593B|nr:biogenesis of lysosome-related organelles complex 1 subunit 4-like [Pollicipes pollicipes]XP_037069143.1 biogenesis of lysosome-related organelles complex 1 subunit 4-like [Pollicipes pollicipes]XP_037069144.1 biogenesis of lysosome-related organelles complex 1 subunit 4-like [Pollicipes pollicipes]XP_037069146.1 biogenesis of lysosome-related organelles complex 1 subunit 4-like [Pollicipes pollicipes]
MDRSEGHEISAEMAQDYSAFAQVDFSQECQKLDVAIEDMLAKLEEFGSLMEMMSECSGAALSEMVPRVFAARQRLQQLFQRVDAMETFVATAGSQLARLEEQMDRAERELAAPGSLTQTFSALFQTRRRDEAQEPAVFTPPEIYRSEDFFHQRSEPLGVPEG